MRRAGPVLLLAASASLLFLAPLAMPESYSWTEHGVSESAAQGVPNAWIARTGFVLFGVAVLWLAKQCSQAWQQPGTALLAGFGLSMVGVGAFSARSWEEATPWSQTEDSLHSLFASTVGATFILGLTSVLLTRMITMRKGGHTRSAAFKSTVAAGEVVPLGIACVVPLAMSSPAWGVLQRLMFAGAYFWFASAARSGAEAAITSLSEVSPRLQRMS